MNRLNRYFAIAVLALIVAPTVALAAAAVYTVNKTVDYSHPTQYTDGSAIVNPATELETYEMGCGPTSSDRTTVVKTWAAGEPKPRQEAFGIGTWYCALRVKSVTNSTQTGGWSGWSGVAGPFTVAAPTKIPMAPPPPVISDGGTP